ncbi:MAG TPA: response regulator [Burkholderiales bacterium]|jgi:signal transduction histidine kinase|nr:response regulator [Burkholderiales bacterium]
MRLACVPMIDPVPTSTSMSFPLSTTATAGVTVMDAVTCNVLIVDDDPHMLRALRELLIGPDRNIIVAQSGEDALRAILKTDFAVILLDVNMSNMDGIETARLIRKREGSRNTPILFMTGTDDDAFSSFRGYQVGAVDYLVKPVLPEVLRSKISVFLDLYRYNAGLAREIAERKAIEDDLRRAEEQVRAFRAHIESAREDERASLAREVHDELGQAMTGLKMDLAWLEKRLPKEQKEAADKVKSMFPLVDATIQSVRRISSALRPQVLDDVGLIATLRWQAGEFQLRTGIRCNVDLPADEVAFDRAQSTAAFRILQEVLANVARHSGATRVDITLRVDSDHFILKIADNGRGMSEAQLRDPKSLGLLGIRERAFLLGGRVDFEAEAGSGTTVTLSIPHPRMSEPQLPAMRRSGAPGN